MGVDLGLVRRWAERTRDKTVVGPLNIQSPTARNLRKKPQAIPLCWVEIGERKYRQLFGADLATWASVRPCGNPISVR